MDIDVITQYILSIAPAVTAIMGMVVVIGVGIGKIKKALAGNEETVERISSRTKEIEFSDKFSLFSNSKIFIGERRNDLFLLELPNIVIDKFPFYYIKTIDLPRGGLGLGYKFENTSLSIVHTLKEQGYIKSLSFGFYKLFGSERYLFFGDVY